ncbi:MAG: glycosyltransferase [Gammaproteobacteria bacterium]|jgi:glycosyltransferase involved in cell wall biosynthesis
MSGLLAEQRTPQVSVVLPVRNAAHTIDECLDSIVRQTYERFEVIIIDDGSTDDSLRKIRHWCDRDRRIRYYQQPFLGLVPALNKGLALAKGKYIARMDADDIMLQNRLHAQVEFLNHHPHIVLVATQVELFPKNRVTPAYQEYIGWQNQCLTSRDIADEIYVESPVAHPTVMMRREACLMLGGYRQGDFPEDYDLWLRMISHGMRLAKLPQVLLKWRDYSHRTSRVDNRYHKQKFDELRAKHLARDPRIHSQRPLVLWGAGRKTRKRVALSGIKPALWVDVDTKKIGKCYQGARVEHFSWLRDQSSQSVKPFVLSYVNNHGVRELIAKELQRCGFHRGDDYLMVG